MWDKIVEAVSIYKQTSTKKDQAEICNDPGKGKRNRSGVIWDAEMYIGQNHWCIWNHAAHSHGAFGNDSCEFENPWGFQDSEL